MKAYLYEPTGEKARAVKRRYQGCVARLRSRRPPTARKGRGDASACCKSCHGAP